jgi:hypothetical protein
MWDPLRHLWLAAVVVSQSSSLGQQAEAGWACEQRKSGLLPRVTRNKQKKWLHRTPENTMNAMMMFSNTVLVMILNTAKRNKDDVGNKFRDLPVTSRTSSLLLDWNASAPDVARARASSAMRSSNMYSDGTDID